MTNTSKPALVRVDRSELITFCATLFVQHGLTVAEAAVSADVLVAADARGIPSHGVARLPWYLGGMRNGMIVPGAGLETLAETASTLAADARGAMGAVASYAAMQRVIEKAARGGVALAAVRNSNHFGVAAYYAMMALPHDMLGVAMTNTAALGVPTFGRQVMYGTNPIAFAAPADREGAFVLDMSTTVVTKGKLEVYGRLEEPLPPGWAVDASGRSHADPNVVLDDMFRRVGGGLLPLGGEGELLSGYKGYGLAVMVDILCAVLAGGAFGPDVADTEHSFGRVSHFFAAVRIDAFRDPAAFRRDMDTMLAGLRATPPAVGAERVYVAGDKEFAAEAAANRLGVPLLRRTYDMLVEVGAEHGVPAPAR